MTAGANGRPVQPGPGASFAELRRWLRDDEVWRGRCRPRTQRETEIWLAGVDARYGPRRGDSGLSEGGEVSE